MLAAVWILTKSFRLLHPEGFLSFFLINLNIPRFEIMHEIINPISLTLKLILRKMFLNDHICFLIPTVISSVFVILSTIDYYPLLIWWYANTVRFNTDNKSMYWIIIEFTILFYQLQMLLLGRNSITFLCPNNSRYRRYYYSYISLCYFSRVFLSFIIWRL